MGKLDIEETITWDALMGWMCLIELFDTNSLSVAEIAHQLRIKSETLGSDTQEKLSCLC